MLKGQGSSTMKYLGWTISICHVILLARIQECVAGTSIEEKETYDCTGNITGDCRPPSTCQKEFDDLCEGKEGFCCPDDTDLSSTFLREMKKKQNKNCNNRRCVRYNRGWWADECGEDRHLFFCKKTAKWCCNKECQISKSCSLMGGHCTTDESSCNGEVRHRGCDGPSCVCCIPYREPLCSGSEVISASLCQDNITVWSEGPMGKVHTCQWQINVPVNHATRFSFSKLDMGGDCSLGSLQVDHPLESETYCGYANPAPFTLLSGNVDVAFSTAAIWSGGGFALEYSSIYYEDSIGSCPFFTVTVVDQGNSGTISIGSTTDTYESNLYCEWQLVTPPDTTVDISFLRFDLEFGSSSCPFDYVEVIDLSSLANITSKVCGSSLPSNVSSSGNNVLIRLRTDGSVENTGFTLNFNAVSTGGHTTVSPEVSTLCDGFEGVLDASSNPSNLTVWYDVVNANGHTCTWRIEAPFDSTIRVSLNQIEVGNCNGFGSIAIHDYAYGYPYDFTSTKYCQSGNSSTYISQRNYIWVTFWAAENWNERGFSLQYDTIPSQVC